MRIQLGIKLESHRATCEAFHGGLEDPWRTSAELDAYPETEKLQSRFEDQDLSYETACQDVASFDE